MGIFSRKFNQSGYHSPALIHKEKTHHFAAISDPQTPHHFRVHEIIDGLQKELSGPLPLDHALQKVHQHFGLRHAALRTAAEHPDHISVVTDLMPHGRDISWQPAARDLAGAAA